MTNKDDEQKKEQPKHVLDLDAYAKKHPHALTIGQLQELSKKNRADLTPAQRNQLDEANAEFKRILEPMMPQITEAVKAGQKIAEAARKALGDFKMPDYFGTLSEPLSTQLTRNVTVPAIIPPASSIEQQKQTFLLQRMVEAVEAQSGDKWTDLKNAITPRYDADLKVLVFCNRIIDVTKGKDYERFCKIMFRNGALLRHNTTNTVLNGVLSRSFTNANLLV